jgi:lysophospholipase L1-like esterase
MGFRRWMGAVSAMFVLGAVGEVAHAQEVPLVAGGVPTYLDRAFASFDAADRAAMPLPDGVLFVGSSSIAFWPDLRAEFEEHPVIVQRGIAGSRMSDLALHVDRLVVRYRPARIVVYAGENDIAGGTPPAAVLEAFGLFVARVTEALPGVFISWVSIKPSPSRWNMDAAFRETNALVKGWVGGRGEVEYIDLHQSMLGPDGLPRREYYAPDQLHLSAEGYTLWEEVIEARLRQLPAVGGRLAAGDAPLRDAVEQPQRGGKHEQFQPEGRLPRIPEQGDDHQRDDEMRAENRQ